MPEQSMPEQPKKKFAAVGTGGRIPMFSDSLLRDYSEYAELVGLCDASLTRVNYHRERLKNQYGIGDIPAYSAADFERMVQETKPDTVVVCTMDSTHHEYIIKALDLGCNVVTEKPMTIDAEKCRAIFEAVQRSGKKVQVAFNYRWSPGVTKVRELVSAGTIGTVKAVNMEYLLNTSHGADYFRRWHSQKECSGGLLVHKSTHHFDLVNWIIDAIPQEIFAYGKLNFYGKENAVARGDEAYTRYDRYTGVPEAKDDPFALTLEENPRKALYLDAEEESGYIRDRNVFRAGINIEDTVSMVVKYRTGVFLNYSLVAYAPYEGYRLTLTGDRGRIEWVVTHKPHIISGQSDLELAKEQQGHGDGKTLWVMPHFKPSYEVEIPEATGGHGGGDPLIQQQIFHSNPPEEKFGRLAGHEQGAASILIGAAANISMTSGKPVQVTDLYPLRPEAKHLSELI
jgi:predicted dehydrogenase